jgi:hypothetical protein
LTPEQGAFARVVARRALLARDLAYLRPDGTLLLHHNLLTAVGACAYAEDSVLLYHWPSHTTQPQRLFGHLHQDAAVIHTRPNPILHRFTLLPTAEAWIEQILAFCHLDLPEPVPAWEFTTARQVFADARQMAELGDIAPASAILREGGLGPEAAAALAKTWSTHPRVSIMQTVKRTPQQALRTREFTLIQNGTVAWWVAPEGEADPQAGLRISAVGPAEAAQLLRASLG